MEKCCIPGNFKNAEMGMGVDDPAQKLYKDNIYGGKRRHFRSCFRWSDGVSQACQVVNIGMLEFLIKACLDQTPVIVPLMMMKIKH